MPRAISKAGLLRKLQYEFNLYIRLRDTSFDDEGNRLGDCISCGAEKPFEQLQAGHFVPAHHPYTRFDERNVNAQCQRCNKWLHGDPFGYLLALRGLYGANVVFELAAARKHKHEYSPELIRLMIEMYQKKQKEVE